MSCDKERPTLACCQCLLLLGLRCHLSSGICPWDKSRLPACQRTNADSTSSYCPQYRV